MEHTQLIASNSSCLSFMFHAMGDRATTPAAQKDPQPLQRPVGVRKSDVFLWLVPGFQWGYSWDVLRYTGL